jgi:GNAT superfamily N-acetyltransferase
VVGAVHNSEITGHVIVTPETAAEPELAVFVHPAHRRRGVATELTKHAIMYAINSGYSALRMEVGVVNRPALGVATKLGFELIEDVEETNRFALVCLRYALDIDEKERINITTTET